MPSQDRFQILFIVGSNPFVFILPEYLSNFGDVSRRHLKTEEEFFLSILPVIPKIRGSSFLLPSRIIPFVGNSFFSTIRSMSEVVSRFFSPEAVIPEEFFVLTFQLPLSNYPGASFKYSSIRS